MNTFFGMPVNYTLPKQSTDTKQVQPLPKSFQIALVNKIINNYNSLLAIQLNQIQQYKLKKRKRSRQSKQRINRKQLGNQKYINDQKLEQYIWLLPYLQFDSTNQYIGKDQNKEKRENLRVSILQLKMYSQSKVPSSLKQSDNYYIQKWIKWMFLNVADDDSFHMELNQIIKESENNYKYYLSLDSKNHQFITQPYQQLKSDNKEQSIKYGVEKFSKNIIQYANYYKLIAEYILEIKQMKMISKQKLIKFQQLIKPRYSSRNLARNIIIFLCKIFPKKWKEGGSAPGEFLDPFIKDSDFSKKCSSYLHCLLKQIFNNIYKQNNHLRMDLQQYIIRQYKIFMILSALLMINRHQNQPSSTVKSSTQYGNIKQSISNIKTLIMYTQEKILSIEFIKNRSPKIKKKLQDSSYFYIETDGELKGLLKFLRFLQDSQFKSANNNYIQQYSEGDQLNYDDYIRELQPVFQKIKKIEMVRRILILLELLKNIYGYNFRFINNTICLDKSTDIDNNFNIKADAIGLYTTQVNKTKNKMKQNNTQFDEGSKQKCSVEIGQYNLSQSFISVPKEFYKILQKNIQYRSRHIKREIKWQSFQKLLQVINVKGKDILSQNIDVCNKVIQLLEKLFGSKRMQTAYPTQYLTVRILLNNMVKQSIKQKQNNNTINMKYIPTENQRFQKMNGLYDIVLDSSKATSALNIKQNKQILTQKTSLGSNGIQINSFFVEINQTQKFLLHESFSINNQILTNNQQKQIYSNTEKDKILANKEQDQIKQKYPFSIIDQEEQDILDVFGPLSPKKANFIEQYTEIEAKVRKLIKKSSQTL